MEGRLLYFSRWSYESNWRIRSVAISQAHIDSTKPFSPSSSQVSDWMVVEELVEELSKMCSEKGAMKGWKLHFLAQPEALRDGEADEIVKYGARAILTRVIEPLASNTPRTEPVPNAQTREFYEKLWGKAG